MHLEEFPADGSGQRHPSADMRTTRPLRSIPGTCSHPWAANLALKLPSVFLLPNYPTGADGFVGPTRISWRGYYCRCGGV